MNPRAKNAKGAARRERILDALRDAIVRDGVDGVRMRAFAQDCGVAVATLYNQFGSRDALIAAALERDFRGRYEPLSQGSADASPAEQVSRRILQAAHDIRQMREYTASVLGFYFRPDVDPMLRAVVHDFVANDFRGIVDHIADDGDLVDWVDRDMFADDLVTMLYAISLTWVQTQIPPTALETRLLRAGATAFCGISTGATRERFEALARNVGSEDQPHAAAAASRPAMRP